MCLTDSYFISPIFYPTSKIAVFGCFFLDKSSVFRTCSLHLWVFDFPSLKTNARNSSLYGFGPRKSNLGFQPHFFSAFLGIDLEALSNETSAKQTNPTEASQLKWNQATTHTLACKQGPPSAISIHLFANRIEAAGTPAAAIPADQRRI